MPLEGVLDAPKALAGRKAVFIRRNALGARHRIGGAVPVGLLPVAGLYEFRGCTVGAGVPLPGRHDQECTQEALAVGGHVQEVVLVDADHRTP